MKFTDKEFKQALENLKGSQFTVRDEHGRIVDLTNEPPMERILEEIQFIQLQNQKEVNK